MRYTISTNSLATVNYLAAASDIINLFDNLGFTSENKVDSFLLEELIADVIRKNVEGNVYYGVDLGEVLNAEVVDTEPTLEEILAAEAELHPTCGCGCCDCYDSDWDKTDEDRNM